jgi:hypothetical protein
MYGSSSRRSKRRGNSWGKARNFRPVRSMERMALIPSRMAVVRGCPPGLAGGMSGSRIALSSSLRSRGIASSLHLSTSSLWSLLGILFLSLTPPSFYHVLPLLAEPLPRPLYRLASQTPQCLFASLNVVGCPGPGTRLRCSLRRCP